MTVKEKTGIHSREASKCCESKHNPGVFITLVATFAHPDFPWPVRILVANGILKRRQRRRSDTQSAKATMGTRQRLFGSRFLLGGQRRKYWSYPTRIGTVVEVIIRLESEKLTTTSGLKAREVQKSDAA